MSGYQLDSDSIATLRELVRWWRGRRQGDRARPTIRHDESWPRLMLVKLDAGQSLTSTPGDTATGKEQVGPPGSETDGESFTIYSGVVLSESGATVGVGEHVLCARVNGYWQALVPGEGGGGTPHCTVDFKVKTAPFTNADSTFSVEVTDVVGDALTTIGATLTVENPVGNVTAYMFSGQVDDRGWAQYTGGSPAWRCRGLECRTS